LKVSSVAISSLTFDPSNARKHSAKNLEAIKGSLAKFGQQKPIVVDAKGVVVAGNGTLAAAKELGWDKISAVKTELTGTEAIAFALADNRSAELAEWEADILSKTLASLKADNFDLGAIGFDPEDMQQWVKDAVEVAPGCDEDEVPEAVEPKTKLGDLYQLGEHRLLCGDSTDVLQVEKLMDGSIADIAYCDPPYGMDFVKKSGVLSARYSQYAGEENQDTYLDAYPLIAQFSKGIFLWGGNFVADRLPQSTYWIVWNKQGDNMKAGGPATDQSDCEIAWTNLKYRKIKQYQFVWAGWFRAGNRKDELKTKVHPSQKPVALAEFIFNDHPGDKILDLFLGSGSTLIACEKTKRKCYGMEIDPHYCDVIVARWEKYSGKKAVLVTAGDQRGTA